MRAGACLAASAALVVALAPAAAHAATPDNPWLALGQAMAAPWAHLQKADGDFRDYVLAKDPYNKPRDPYGRAFMGLALLQAGLRDGNQAELGVALKALGKAATHPIRRDRIVFENLALTNAYNFARTHLANDSRFEAIPAAREVMRRAARALWTVASPDGSVSYYGRSQDQSWTLAMTAYGADVTAALPGTSATDSARFHALADRALTRLRDDYAGGAYGF